MVALIHFRPAARPGWRGPMAMMARRRDDMDDEKKPKRRDPAPPPVRQRVDLAGWVLTLIVVMTALAFFAMVIRAAFTGDRIDAYMYGLMALVLSGAFGIDLWRWNR